tara:strand:- start:168 stop:314 length:147 start_codon:yes stop_codon:yes gene_type:complete
MIKLDDIDFKNIFPNDMKGKVFHINLSAQMTKILENTGDFKSKKDVKT